MGPRSILGPRFMASVLDFRTVPNKGPKGKCGGGGRAETERRRCGSREARGSVDGVGVSGCPSVFCLDWLN